MYRWIQGRWRYEAVAPIEDVLVEPSREAKEAVRFYWGNYTCIGQWILEPGKKIVLRSSQPGVCRFCGLAEPEVTFRDKAHAIPESTGNKSLTTKYECDRCNRLFGSGIENDFGNWSKAQRAMSGVRGKGPPPTLKEESRRQWRFEHGVEEIKLTQDENDPIAVVNEDTKEITLTVRRDPYTPVAVLKAFAKMALSLLPEAELPNVHSALAWIRSEEHSIRLAKTSALPLLYTFVPGNQPLGNVSAILLRRKSDRLPVPYLTFVLSYGNEAFQTFLPSPERNVAISGKKVALHYFPIPYGLDRGLVPLAPIERRPIDLTSCSLVKGEMIQTIMSYDRGTHTGFEGDGPSL